MCTLSFVPTEHGYYAAMNRDERLTRAAALPPALFRVGDIWAAYPHELDGGTWFATNEYGISLALLNWNLPDIFQEKQRTRGCLIPQLIGHHDFEDVTRDLNSTSLNGILPFRLVGIFYPQQQACEWRWDGESLEYTGFPWELRHWFSSGLSDELAERERAEACRIAWQDPAAGSLPWLRALHRSHSALPGPFSVCVHRPDAATVSYSEVDYSPEKAQFSYVAGQPCHDGPVLTLDIPLDTHQNLVRS